MQLKFSFVILLLAFLTSTVFASETRCPEHFANGQAPDLINQKLSVKTQDICYSEFALKHSGVTRTPLYAAEHLTRERLSQAKGLKRSGKFHPEAALSVSERAELRHYSRSGYDRGHIAPSGDMSTTEFQQECFTLANMIPQEPSVNRGIWEAVESVTRKLAKARGNLYIISGPIFSGKDIQRIGGTVMVPTRVFKAIYDPDRNECGAYIVDNIQGAQVRIITIEELEMLSGISLFPSLDSQVKKRGMSLPTPKEHKRKGAV